MSSKPRMFAEADLAEALEEAGSKIRRKVPIYLIGGCAMTFMGRKAATKDIDVVLASARDAKDFLSALLATGFRNVRRLASEYDALGTFAIVEDSKGMRFDIFDRRVCRALEISDGMKSRSRLYRSFGGLNAYLMSPEDIFLFKGITEREADLDDIRILAEMRLDWSAIEKECLSQRKSGSWAYMLGTKLLELRAKSGIDSPIIRTLMEHADLDLLRHVFAGIIGDGRPAFKEIARAIKEKYGYSDSWTRKQLASLVAKQIIVQERHGSQTFYRVRARP